jgi:hypothetical protein
MTILADFRGGLVTLVSAQCTVDTFTECCSGTGLCQWIVADFTTQTWFINRTQFVARVALLFIGLITDSSTLGSIDSLTHASANTTVLGGIITNVDSSS